MVTTTRIGVLGQHDVGGNVKKLEDPQGEEEDLKELIEFAASHEYSDWEKRMHALVVCLGLKKIMNWSQFRRTIEGLHPDVYNRVTYYEKWAAAASNILTERGLLTQEEINESLGPLSEVAAVATGEKPQFEVGDKVVVRREDFRTRWRRPHARTPGYIFGCSGVIERYCGAFNDPQAEWFGVKGAMPCYRVRFSMKDIWTPPGVQTDTNENDTIDVEIFQNWLIPAAKAGSEKAIDSVQMKPEDSTEFVTEGTHTHGHKDHGDHVHEARAQVETTALDRETGHGKAMDRPLALLAQRLLTLCDQHGIVTAADIAEALENVSNAGEKTNSRLLVVRAWTDPEFKALLLRDPLQACKDLKLVKPDFDPHTRLTCLESTNDVHNVVVCTLCSCYPVWLLGMSPSWYKSRSYRARIVLEPRRVLRELFGVTIPAEKKVRVHDSTAELRYFVLPQRPVGTDGWTEEELLKVVTRDSMIGTGVCRDPATISTAENDKVGDPASKKQKTDG
eukprot:Clim_evm30s240 gene=Clim_evmTU30s240